MKQSPALDSDDSIVNKRDEELAAAAEFPLDMDTSVISVELTQSELHLEGEPDNDGAGSDRIDALREVSIADLPQHLKIPATNESTSSTEPSSNALAYLQSLDPTSALVGDEDAPYQPK